MLRDVEAMLRDGRRRSETMQTLWSSFRRVRSTRLSDLRRLLLEKDDANVLENVKKWLVRPDADRRYKLLACGAFLVAELRLQVLQETQFTCSPGIAHNKFQQMLAKLVSGMNKPAQQTVVSPSSIAKLLRDLPIKKMLAKGACWCIGRNLEASLVHLY